MLRFLFILLLSLYSFLLAQVVDAQFLAADQSLMTMPTAYTMPQGQSSLTDFEVLLVQYSYALTNIFHISGGMVFPMSAELLKTFTFGTKTNYYRGKTVQSALWASYTPDPKTSTLGNIVSIGNPEASIHVLTATTLDFRRGKQQPILGLGGIKNFSDRTSGIAEFYYAPDIYKYFEDDESDLKSLKIIMLGIRFKGQRMSWDFGAFRPLGMDAEDLIGIPFIKATFIF